MVEENLPYNKLWIEILKLWIEILMYYFVLCKNSGVCMTVGQYLRVSVDTHV